MNEEIPVFRREVFQGCFLIRFWKPVHDFQDINFIRSALDAAGSERNVIIDFKNLKIMSSSLFGVLVEFEKKQRRNHHRLILIQLNKDVQAVLSLAHADKLFEIVPTLEDAANLLNDEKR